MKVIYLENPSFHLKMFISIENRADLKSITMAAHSVITSHTFDQIKYLPVPDIMVTGALSGAVQIHCKVRPYDSPSVLCRLISYIKHAFIPRRMSDIRCQHICSYSMLCVSWFLKVLQCAICTRALPCQYSSYVRKTNVQMLLILYFGLTSHSHSS